MPILAREPVREVSVLARRLKVLERFQSRGSLLVVSAGDDTLANAAARAGWRTALAGIGDCGTPLCEGLWPGGSFDAVALCGVLECAEAPDILLRRAAHYCRLDGLLLVETWDGDHPGAFRAAPRLYTHRALTMLLARHGFRENRACRLPGPDGAPDDAVTLCVVAQYSP
ncbi:MAG: hypothetical protein BWY76_03246 [bacterium ADurb.Bin429]|nr:MAG: hypothetical protein BWY76_03246 [bacterium ADurb.Bin429]